MLMHRGDPAEIGRRERWSDDFESALSQPDERPGRTSSPPSEAQRPHSLGCGVWGMRCILPAHYVTTQSTPAPRAARTGYDVKLIIVLTDRALRR